MGLFAKNTNDLMEEEPQTNNTDDIWRYKFIFMIKKILIAFCFFSLLFSCKKDESVDGIIDENKMANVLKDMHITDAYLSDMPSSGDTLLREAKTRYDYIFKKYGIDSTKFSNSLKYYSERPKSFQEIYSVVMDSLTKLDTKPLIINNEPIISVIDTAQLRRPVDSILRIISMKKLNLVDTNTKKVDTIINKAIDTLKPKRLIDVAPKSKFLKKFHDIPKE